jgi:hypothetical protein
MKGKFNGTASNGAAPIKHLCKKITILSHHKFPTFGSVEKVKLKLNGRALMELIILDTFAGK